MGGRWTSGSTRSGPTPRFRRGRDGASVPQWNNTFRVRVDTAPLLSFLRSPSWSVRTLGPTPRTPYGSTVPGRDPSTKTGGPRGQVSGRFVSLFSLAVDPSISPDLPPSGVRGVWVVLPQSPTPVVVPQGPVGSGHVRVYYPRSPGVGAKVGVDFLPCSDGNRNLVVGVARRRPGRGGRVDGSDTLVRPCRVEKGMSHRTECHLRRSPRSPSRPRPYQGSPSGGLTLRGNCECPKASGYLGTTPGPDSPPGPRRYDPTVFWSVVDPALTLLISQFVPVVRVGPQPPDGPPPLKFEVLLPRPPFLYPSPTDLLPGRTRFRPTVLPPHRRPFPGEPVQCRYVGWDGSSVRVDGGLPTRFTGGVSGVSRTRTEGCV